MAWTLGRTHQLRKEEESRDEMWPYEAKEDRSSELGQTLTQLSSMQAKGEIGLHVPDELCGVEEEGAWDDVSGKELDRELVMEARRTELEYYKSHKVYKKAPVK